MESFVEIFGRVISNKEDEKEAELKNRPAPHYGSVRVLINQVRLNPLEDSPWTTCQYVGEGVPELGIPSGPIVPVLEIAYKINCELNASHDSDENYQHTHALKEGSNIFIAAPKEFYTHKSHKYSCKEGRYSLYLKLWGNTDVVYVENNNAANSASVLDAVSVYRELLRR